MCQGLNSLYLGMVIPPLIENSYDGYINPYCWVDEFIPDIEIMGLSLDPIPHIELFTNPPASLPDLHRLKHDVSDFALRYRTNLNSTKNL